MKKTSFLFALFSILFSFALNAENLLSNPGFENSSDFNLPANEWKKGTGGFGGIPIAGTDIVFSRSSDSHKGNNSLLIDTRIVQDAAKRISSPLLNNTEYLTPGTYKISVYVKDTDALRFVSLIKERTTPSSSGISNNNFYTFVDKETAKTREKWTLVESIVCVPETIEAGAYFLNLGFRYTAAFNSDDYMLIDDIIVKKEISSLKLEKLAFVPNTNYNGNELSIKGFTADKFEYTMQTSLPTHPIVSVLAESESVVPAVIQAENLTGTPGLYFEEEVLSYSIINSNDKVELKIDISCIAFGDGGLIKGA